MPDSNAELHAPLATASPPAAPVDGPQGASILAAVYGNTARAALLEQSLAPYRAQLERNQKTILTKVDDAGDVYRFGDDVVLVGGDDSTEIRTLSVPEGVWVNYWTGLQMLGGHTVALNMEGIAFPMWVRGGTVLSLAASTIGPLGAAPELLNDSTCEHTCQYEILSAFGGVDVQTETSESIDAKGRKLTRHLEQLTVHGDAVHAVVRWRFDRVKDVRLNGAPVPLLPSTEGDYIEFDHTADTTVTWARVADFKMDRAIASARARTAGAGRKVNRSKLARNARRG